MSMTDAPLCRPGSQVQHETLDRAVAPGAAAAAAQLSACHALALFHRTCAAVLVIPVAASLGVDAREAASLSIVFFCVYALLQLPSGVLADLFGSLRIACAGSVVTGAGAIGFALAPGLALAVTSRALIAAGCAVTFVALVRHVKTHWPSARVATISGRGILLGNVGAIASSAPLALVLVFLDWRTLLLGLGVVSLSLAIGLYLQLARFERPPRTSARLGPFWAELRSVWRNRYNHYGFIVLAGLAGAYWAFVGFFGLPLLVDRGVPASIAAWQICGMIGAYAAGASLLGALGDRLNRRGATLSASCAGALLCWMLLLSDATGDLARLTLVLALLGFFCGGFNLVFALVTERNPSEHAGTVIAFINIGTFLGAALLQAYASAAFGPHGAAAGVHAMGGAALVALAFSSTLWIRERRTRTPRRSRPGMPGGERVLIGRARLEAEAEPHEETRFVIEKLCLPRRRQQAHPQT
jgi:MFS family permease